MTLEAEQAKDVGYQLEAKKDGLKQVQSGDVKLTLTIQAQDMPNSLYGDPMGQRYMCVMVPLNDDETPKVTPDKPKSKAGSAKLLAQQDGYWMSKGVDTQEEAEARIKLACNVKSCSEIIEGTIAADMLRKIWHNCYKWKKVQEQEAHFMKEMR